MATAEQIINMIKAYSASDDERFKTIALQIAAHEAKLGHGSLAQEIKKQTDTIGKNKPLIKINSNMNSLLDYSMPTVMTSDLIADEDVTSKIRRILSEFRNRRTLRDSGLSNRRKILLEGKPGTGKTMTASIIASELSLPLFTVQVDKLVTKFMGETSVRLRQVFEQMGVSIGVYFFDEFDAIGADRALDNEVGEMRRILNSFLQFMDTEISESIIIAATNNQRVLDKALFRRFDDVIHYELPDENQIIRLYTYRLDGFADKSIIDSDIVRISKGLCHAELSLICDDAIKESILNNKPISKELITSLANERHRIYQRMEA